MLSNNGFPCPSCTSRQPNTSVLACTSVPKPPKPYDGYNESEAGTDFGFVRSFDGHIATDRYGHDDGRSHRNARKGWDEADISQYPEGA